LRSDNIYQLIHVEPGARLDPYDIILQFKKRETKMNSYYGNVDVKATSDDIPTSGRSPNILHLQELDEYINDPDYIFIILSLSTSLW